MKKNGQRRYKYIVLGRDKSNYKHSNSTRILINNICVMFVGRVLKHKVGVVMGTNCAPNLAGLFLYSYKADFIHRLLNENKRKIVRSIL